MSKEGLVFPSSELGVIEEFLPGENTYVDERGFIRASVMGKAVIDLANRVARVDPVGRARRLALPREGATVIATITFMRQDFAASLISALLENKKMVSTGPFAGVLHISQVTQEYVKSLYDHFAIGDVILARCLNSYNPYQLTTKGAGLGVILSYCGACGDILRLENGKLRCPRCGLTAQRLVSRYYVYTTRQRR